MICGSVNMQREVIDILAEISSDKLKTPLSEYENMEQIKMDCY
jgi:sulfite reductase (NADPH) flavoprotein alpha-component